MTTLKKSKLEDELAEIPSGRVFRTQKRGVERALADVWDRLDGSADGGMRPDKIRDRTESMEWDPPHLRFKIERHGLTRSTGGVLAQVQSWTVNVNAGTAELTAEQGRRIVDTGRVKKRERRARERLAEWMEASGERNSRTLKVKGRGYVDALPLTAMPHDVRQVMAECAKGSYQMELIAGCRRWGDIPDDTWASGYLESRENLLDRLREATGVDSNVDTRLVLDGSNDHPRWTLRLVIERPDGIYIQ